MKFTSLLFSVFLVLVSALPAAAQIAEKEYISPITVEKLEATYNVNADGTYTMEQISSVRINLDQVVSSAAQSYLQFSDSLQSLEVMEAYTETPEGEKIAVADDKIITKESPISVQAPDFNDYKTTAIVFPQISVGAIKTIHYRMTQIKPHFENHFSMFEAFPLEVDIKSAIIRLIAPEDLKLYIQAVDIEGGKVESNIPGKSEWVWKIEDQKGQMPEQNSISAQNYSPRLVVSTFANHNEVAEAYLKGAEEKEKITAKVRELADQITKDLSEPEPIDKARALYNWVNEKIRYVSLTFGLGGVVPRDVDSIIDSGYGDCKDKVTLLNSLLAAQNIKAVPVLINSDDLYWDTDVALALGIYNHAITYLPEFDMFVDPTIELAPFGGTVTRMTGKNALVTRGLKNGSGIIKTPESSADKSNIHSVTDIIIDDQGTAKCKTVTRARGALGLYLRGLIDIIPPGQEKVLAKQLLASVGHEGEGNISSSNPRDLTREDIEITTEFTIQNAMLLPGPGAFLLPELHLRPIKVVVPMTRLPERKTAMVYSRYSKTEITNITFPESAKILTLPKDVSVANQYGGYSASYTQEGQTVKIERNIWSEVPRGLCTPDIYPTVQEIGNLVMRDLRSQILYE